MWAGERIMEMPGFVDFNAFAVSNFSAVLLPLLTHDRKHVQMSTLPGSVGVASADYRSRDAFVGSAGVSMCGTSSWTSEVTVPPSFATPSATLPLFAPSLPQAGAW